MHQSLPPTRPTRFPDPDRRLLTAVFALSLLSGMAGASTRDDTHLTIYQSDLALVQQHHQITLNSDREWISLPNISADLLTDSVRIDSSASIVRQQRYLNLPINQQNLLEAHLGKQIDVLHEKADGTVVSRSVQLLTSDGNEIVVRDEQGRIEILPLSQHHRFRFDHTPKHLTLTPQIQVLLEGSPGQQTLDLSYLTRQLSWHTNYDLVLLDDIADLTSNVSLSNQTRQSWNHASIALVAGKPNRVQAPPVLRESRAPRTLMMAADHAGAPQYPSRKKLGPYHLYSLPGHYNLQSGETRQIRLFTAQQAVRKLFRFEAHAGGGLYSALAKNNGANALPAQMTLLLKNTPSPSGSQQPWPAGLWRIYSGTQTASGDLRLLGEDRGKATPVGNQLSLNVGEAFDVTAVRSQTSFKRIDKKQSLSDWRIELRNAGTTEVEIQVIEHLGNHWQITRESHPRKKSADYPQVSSAVWFITLPPQSTRTLQYQIRAQRP